VAGWILIGLLAGLARAEWSQHRPPSDVRNLPATSTARITGRLASAPGLYSPASGRFPLDIDGLEIDGKPAPWRGRILVNFYREPPALIGGERVAIEGRLRPLRPPTNPGVYDRAARLDRDGLGATLSTSRPIQVLEPALTFRPTAWMDGARAGLRDLLARHAPPDVAAFQSALLFGSREDLPPELTTSLQRTGTAHFLAVSGFNLVLVLVVFWYLLLLLGFRGSAVPALLLGVLLAYTALTGWQVSVVRAFLMSAAVLGARLFWRRSDVVNSLCLAALAILLWDPGQLFDTGFQLSFVAVLGIVAVGPIYHEYLAPPPGPPGSALLGWLGRQSRGALAVTIGAWLATAPIVLATFHLVTPVILGANLALCPLVTIQSFLSLAALPLAVFFPPGADGVGILASWVFDATLGGASALTGFPAAYLFLPAMPAWAMVAYYGLLAAWTWRARARPDRFKPWLCVAFAAALAVTPLGFRNPAHPILGVVDVGRGSSAYLRSPDGSTIVFDCGSLSYRDPGAMVTAPVLWSRGVSRAHTFVLSHADADHVNGASSVMERLGTRRLVVPRGFDHDVLDFARDRGIEVVHAGRGDVVPGLEILGPPPGSQGWPANERSLVVRVSTPGGSILIPGDIEELGTRALLASGLDLRADVLLLPHHGKRQDLHRELLAAVKPKIVLVSAPEGYASQEVLDHARAAAVVYQTGLEGWFEIDLGGMDGR
jgi:competence protein ComEC